MFSMRNGLLVVIALLVAAAPAVAIELGDPAPALKVKEWVKGKPVDLAAGKGKDVYVVEFWATWCPPCRASIPHLSELQKKFKDKGVVIIGISASDKDLDTVKAFVKDQGDKMDYTVAYEEKGKGDTDKAYMGGFKKNGIPQAFVIDKKGNIVWEGHPMSGLDEVIAAVLGGESDAKKLGEISEKAAKAQMEKERAKAELVEKYFELVSSKKAENAKDAGEKLVKEFSDDAMTLNEIAWRILTDEDVQTRDKDLALRAAKKANELTDGKEAAILDTYARALWDTGSKKEAVEMQKKAVSLCKDDDMKADLEKTLKKYQEKP